MQARIIGRQRCSGRNVQQAIVRRNEDKWFQFAVNKGLIGSQRGGQLYRIIGAQRIAIKQFAGACDDA